MRRPSISLLSVLTPQKRRQLYDNNSPSPKRLCLWGRETTTRGQWTQQRSQSQDRFTSHSRPSTPTRPLKPNKQSHSARKARELRRPQVRLSSRSRSKSLTRLNYSTSSSSRKRKLDTSYAHTVSKLGKRKNYGLRRPSVSLVNPCLEQIRANKKQRSRSLSFSSGRSSSVRRESLDRSAVCRSSPLNRKRSRLSSILTPPTRARKCSRKLLLTRSPSKPILHEGKGSNRLQVMNRTKIPDNNAIEAEQNKLEDLQTCTQRLMVQLASATLKMENLNTETEFYKNVLSEIQSVVSFAENSVVFSAFPNMQL